MLFRHFRFSRRRVACAVAYAAACAAALGAVQAAPLSFDNALRLAQQRSHQLPAFSAAAAAAREMAVAAAQRPDPVLKAGINNLPVDGPDRLSLTSDFMTMRSVGVMQEFTNAAKLGARAARFDREAEAAEAGRQSALAGLQRDTAIAWLERHYQERILEALHVLRAEAALQIDAAQAAYRGARGSQADVFAARAGLAQIDDRVAQAERQVAIARTQLARWVGEAAAEPLGDAPALAQVHLSSEGIDAQLAHHPQIEALRTREAVAQAEVELARANQQTDLSAELMFSQRGPAYSNMVSFNVAIPLQWDRAKRQDREHAARLAMAQQLQAERAEATRAHAAEALTMLLEWRSHRDRLARYDVTLLPLAGERTQAALAAYRGATGALGAVLEARRAEIDTRIERLRLESDAARLWAQLEFLAPAADRAIAPVRP